MILKQIVLFSILLLLLGRCSNNQESNSKVIKIKNDTLNDDSIGPPFKNHCLCKFKYFGSYEISKNNYNEYYCGKGWNPDLNECSWIWGEIIYNRVPNDSNEKSLKVHLIDIDTFKLPINHTEYGNDSIKNYVIAIVTIQRNGGSFKCVFDPFKTGKYSKPKNWRE